VSGRAARRSEARQALSSVAVVCVVVLLTVAYMRSVRPRADLELATITASDTMSYCTRASTKMPLVGYTIACDDLALRASLFLESDSAARLPAIAGHVDRAVLAQRVAQELWAEREAGVTRPRVTDIFLGDKAVAEYPSIATLVTGGGPDARFLNADETIVLALWKLSVTEAEAAMTDLGSAYAGFGQ
jgi:hypothetical protein